MMKDGMYHVTVMAGATDMRKAQEDHQLDRAAQSGLQGGHAST